VASSASGGCGTSASIAAADSSSASSSFSWLLRNGSSLFSLDCRSLVMRSFSPCYFFFATRVLLAAPPFFAALFFEGDRVEERATALAERFAADFAAVFFAGVEADFDPAAFAFAALVAVLCAPDLEPLRFAPAPDCARLSGCIF
jgi:hypothetical protein